MSEGVESEMIGYLLHLSNGFLEIQYLFKVVAVYSDIHHLALNMGS